MIKSAEYFMTQASERQTSQWEKTDRASYTRQK